MNVLTFDDAAHRYAVNGRPCMSVTQILSIAGLCDYTYANEFALWRGSAVHKAIHVEITQGLDWSTLPEPFHPFVSAATQFIADEHAEVVDAERRVYSEAYDYAGTLDIVLRVHVTCDESCPHAARRGRLLLADWKSGQPQPWTALQTAGYAWAYFEETKQLAAERCAVHVKQTGDYAVTHYTDRNDRNAFLAAVTVAHLRREFGLLKGDMAA